MNLDKKQGGGGACEAESCEELTAWEHHVRLQMLQV